MILTLLETSLPLRVIGAAFSGISAQTSETSVNSMTINLFHLLT